MNKGKIYYIINNLLDKYDNGENIEENMFIDALVKIKDIVEENTNKSLLDENYNLQSKIDKAIEYIEKDTRWFDSEYASVYGELCDCEGYNANRLEVMVNPSNLLNILKEDK